MLRTPAFRTIVLVSCAVVLGGAGTATADRLISGKDVRNGSLTGADIKDRSLTAKDFKAAPSAGAAVNGAAGAAGATGATGPAGVAGPKGDRGDKGERGAAGPSSAFSMRLYQQTPTFTDDSGHEVVRIKDLPEGDYVVNATAILITLGGSSTSCNLFRDNEVSYWQSVHQSSNGGNVTHAVTAALHVPEGGDLWLQCTSWPADWYATNGIIVATKVGDLTSKTTQG